MDNTLPAINVLHGNIMDDRVKYIFVFENISEMFVNALNDVQVKSLMVTSYIDKKEEHDKSSDKS